MRTFVATNYKADKNVSYPAAHNEEWAFFPDDSPVSYHVAALNGISIVQSASAV